MTPSNVLFIMSDEHSRRHLGAYDDTFVRTPSMDALAAQGSTTIKVAVRNAVPANEGPRPPSPDAPWHPEQWSP